MSAIKNQRVMWVDDRRAGKIPALPCPGHPDAWVSGILERADHVFVSLDVAGDEDFRSASKLAVSRLLRCKIGSARWWWYTSVSFAASKGPSLHLVPTDGGDR